jgi:hypothetical protein
MDPLFIMAGIALAPVLLLSVLRVNAATAFLGLCLGSVLGNYVAKDFTEVLRGSLAPTPELNAMVIALLLLWLPVVLIVVFMINTIGKKQIPQNLLPAIAVGLFGLILTAPALTPDMAASMQSTEAWDRLMQYQAAIVAIGTLISLLFLRMRKKDGPHKHHSA